MKTTRLTTYWDAEQVITLIGMIDDIREALLYTYQAEIEQYRHQRWLEQCNGKENNLDLFEDNMDF
jgi:hypothetical protein